MKRLYFISTIVSLVFFAGCMVDDIDYSTPCESSDAITVIGRMTRFDEYDVATRGVKDEAESKLTSMAMAIFPVNDAGTALTGNCVYWQYTNNQAELLFTIDRGSNYEYNARYAMYVFTNMDMSEFGIGSSLDAMMAKFHSVEGLNIPDNGFPMMGSLGDTFSTTFDRDNKVFILSPTKANGDLDTPKVDGQTQTLLTIPMKAMYAKVNFTIEVNPDQTIEGNYSPQFTLEGYSVNNIPSTVDFIIEPNDPDLKVLDGGYTLDNADRNTAIGANKINFTFYLPEQLLTPATTWENYDYPFGKGSAIRNEDLVYRQRYKSMLLGNDQKAVNIVISGRYRDHQNHSWDVDYTIYLGEDNYGDFNIKRNSEYNNIVTIRGIQSSSDMSDKEGAISIDHRVNVTRTQPAIISLRHEVMLDSHFEVRPLRVRKSDIGDVEGINAVKVEVLNPGSADTKTGTWWMRLERSFGDGTLAGSPETTVNGQKTSIYIDSDPNSPSYGKRKFFTYNLIDGVNADATDATLKNSTEVILPLTNDTECCWIYVDECTEIGDGIRAGQIKVTYGSLNGSTFTPANNATYPDVVYIINQRKLFEVKYDDPTTTTDENRKYHIEYEEEYLHNFDADDDYGQTEFYGMEWGLEGVQLSYDHQALYFKSITQSDLGDLIVNFFKGDTNAYYDFYIKSHDEARLDPRQVELHEFKGYDFCNEIITTVNGGQKNKNGEVTDTNPDNDINILQLDEQPKSAIEYCYNKNKRNNKGQIVWSTGTNTYDQSQLNWYLPAIDEMEDIVMSTYGSGQNTFARFLEFQSQDYWSCQPAYIQNYAHLSWLWGVFTYWGNFYFDDIGDTNFDKNNNTDRVNIGSARSTSVSYNNGYVKTLSGTNGHYSFYDADDNSYVYSGTFGPRNDKVTIGTISREPGNQPRNEKNRIRCVRKSQYTNTSAN